MNKQQKIAWAITIAAATGGLWLLSRSRNSTPPSLINMSWDFRSNDKLPRGYRNNNPLNIRFHPLNGWKGKILFNTDGVFEQFSNMAYGYRAALYLLRKYIRKGDNTVAKIISRWAPENENDTAKYIQDVCKLAGLIANDEIRENDAGALTALAYAMSICENGQTVATRAAGLPNMDIIYEGWRLL